MELMELDTKKSGLEVRFVVLDPVELSSTAPDAMIKSSIDACCLSKAFGFRW
jgi:hypothetical protein